jgi:predicted peptidase
MSNFNWLRFASFLGMMLTMNAMAADPKDVFEARVYTDANGGKLPYRILKPVDYDANKKYPLVIFLHGAGERGTDNLVQLKHGMADFANDENRKKYPAFVIAPQCPAERKWVEVNWSDPKHDMPSEPSVPMKQTFEVIEGLKKEFSLDDKRFYMTGLSMGGFGTWDALQRKPDYFAAGIPICGGGDVKQAGKLKSIPLWCFHGDQDNAVKVARSREMIAAIKEAGGMPKYTEYPNVGHDSWSATYRNPEVHAWLFEQVRK